VPVVTVILYYNSLFHWHRIFADTIKSQARVPPSQRLHLLAYLPELTLSPAQPFQVVLASPRQSKLDGFENKPSNQTLSELEGRAELHRQEPCLLWLEPAALLLFLFCPVEIPAFLHISNLLPPPLPRFWHLPTHLHI